MAKEPISSEKLETTDEKIPIGAIVSVKTHPYEQGVTDILITTYASYTPPLMIVVEKKYGPKFNTETGSEEDNDQYKCIYYANKSGSFEDYWFKSHEIKLIETPKSTFLDPYKNSSYDIIKKELIGRTVTLTTVDYELEKKKIWSDYFNPTEKMKSNNLLDFLPPVGSIIAVKLVEDAEKFDEKKGHKLFARSKLLVKIRWMNNHTFRFSEYDIPLVALKSIEDQFKLISYDKDKTYFFEEPINLEGSNSISVKRSPLVFTSVIWKHYYYIYMFKNVFTGKDVILRKEDLNTVVSAEGVNPASLQHILSFSNFTYDNISLFFKEKSNVEGRWLAIRYTDKSNRFTQRIIYVSDLLIQDSDNIGSTNIIKSNCLLRKGAIRHFNVDRIIAYKVLNDSFEEVFVR